MKNIIITGGGLANKGAQAMTLITVDALRRKYPDHQIYLYSELDNRRSESEKSIYVFQFIGWHPLKFAICQKKPFLRVLCRLKNGKELKTVENLYRNTELMVDISGYVIGSNWSNKIISDYLDLIEYANSFHIPVYLLPQSFGPFDFPEERAAVEKRIRRLLPTVKKIFAREQEGFDLLTGKLGLTNVERGDDIVLNSKELRLENVFLTVPVIDLPEIEKDSVGIIPNSQNYKIGNEQEIKVLYHDIISGLRSDGKTVYLLMHSASDRKHCEAMKNEWAEDEKVIFLDRDFSCLEFNELVKRFRFMIASRFHSVVHSYKNAVPCVVLGWAVKYRDLMKLFDQEQYMFDVRQPIDTKQVCSVIRELDKNCSAESEKLVKKLGELQKNNIFDNLPEHL